MPSKEKKKKNSSWKIGKWENVTDSARGDGRQSVTLGGTLHFLVVAAAAAAALQLHHGDN